MYLFFDIDDTLLDTANAEHNAALGFAYAFPKVLGPDAEAFNTSWHAISAYYYDKWTSGKLTFREQRRCRIRHFFGSELSDVEADGIFNVYLNLYSEHWVAFPDVLPGLAQLKGQQMAILTNGDPEQQRAKLVALGISERFSLLVTPMDAGVCKPDERIFHYAASQVGTQPADCFYIGDQLDSDARAAMSAGWRSVWLDRSGNGQEVTDVPVIHYLTELPDLLTQMGN